MQKFRKGAEDQVNEAKKQQHDLRTSELENLDNMEAPQTILLRTFKRPTPDSRAEIVMSTCISVSSGIRARCKRAREHVRPTCSVPPSCVLRQPPGES